MIVNPQSFNYRLIIGSLIVAVTILTVYSFTSFQSIRAHEQFLEQEKKLVESELSHMITRYDKVSVSNDLLSAQLEEAKLNTKITLDSLRLLRSDLSVLTKYRGQLYSLKLKNKELFNTIDSLNTVNQSLEQDKLLAYNELKKQQLANSSLIKENEVLEKSLEKGALLTANSFYAKGYQKFLGAKRPSVKAKRVQSIEVCFTLAENALTIAGEKELYIQIVNPKNNVVADKGSINFGNSSLIYSSKKVIEYTNEVVDVCVDVNADIEEQPLDPGTYYISIFHEDRKLGSTEVILK
ncbi:hypothetical protein [Psychroserpens sp.]|uniref:hypothetical protein n=1 Tax=Psychroserpens sp. TaxID=2020870 RepID=UPI001B09E14E|nr:hypothetical protein [Psychroserpens sp.]MBO6605596.1 hypothetical protein [Psychroserpens sp.]MBO6632697.1 hypothetical protein [Psychroserpens sp.]MBO6653595.1 hypothetical protein [Psychroserpens sp.]MBO6681916.1 hypothetical protein [Psychroserpens sp.]MBO6748970.1 hypothetical protein [Psychroserpens sp.]